MLEQERRAVATPLQVLSTTVVQGGYCIGCGACAALDNSPVSIRLDPYGKYQACISADSSSGDAPPVTDVCPFSDDVPTEDEIAAELYAGLAYHSHIGHFRACYAGYVAGGDFRASGSSGGIAKWILYELLNSALVDAVIHVVQRPPDDVSSPLYSYSLITEPNAVRSGSKSVYYPVEMADVLRHIKDKPGRYAITGVPCFIKAIRLLSRAEPRFADRIRYCVGLICGHLKSSAYAEMLGWQLGVRPHELQAIDFRKKLPGRRANEKGVEVRGARDGQEIVGIAGVKELFGTDYGQGLFKYNACDYCDDVVAETADVVVGDAWLPQYVQDGRGTSVVVTRDRELDELIRNACTRGELVLDNLSPDEVSQSQASGLRHRREGLAYRLYLADREGKWRPRKRVQASRTSVTRVQKRIQHLRMETARRSHELFLRAKCTGEYSDFDEPMRELTREYKEAYRPRMLRRCLGILARSARRILFASRLRRTLRAVAGAVRARAR